MFLVRCPKCKNKMKYNPLDGKVKGKKKRCVYCGYTFTIHIDQTKSRIIS